jgi:hypothetical protein
MKKYQIRDPEWKKFVSGMEKIRIQDGKNSDSVSRKNIPDPQHWILPAQNAHLPEYLAAIRIPQVHPVHSAN